MSKFLKYWPLAVTVLGAASTYLSPAVDTFWASHQQLVATIVGLWATFKWLLPSPLQK
jgi:hypothetical protein